MILPNKKETVEQYILRYWKNEYTDLKKHMNKMLAYRATANDPTKGFLDALEERHTQELARYKARVEIHKPRKDGLPEYYVTNSEIALAKLQPIKNYLPNKIIQNKTLCLFHSDSQPSMHIYGNSYHCYACGAHGDVIEIIMKLKNCSFTVAVRFLIGK